MSKQSANMAPYYAGLYLRLAARARELGYALCVHGSMQRDLDVVAAPWAHGAIPAEDLAVALTEVAGGLLMDGVDKPHGRRAFVILLGEERLVPLDEPASPPYVDLSIMPKS